MWRPSPSRSPRPGAPPATRSPPSPPGLPPSRAERTRRRSARWKGLGPSWRPSPLLGQPGSATDPLR
eukprot:1923649-Alexandrium_andersonii.AAC.1